MTQTVDGAVQQIEALHAAMFEAWFDEYRSALRSVLDQSDKEFEAFRQAPNEASLAVFLDAFVRSQETMRQLLQAAPLPPYSSREAAALVRHAVSPLATGPSPGRAQGTVPSRSGESLHAPPLAACDEDDLEEYLASLPSNSPTGYAAKRRLAVLRAERIKLEREDEEVRRVREETRLIKRSMEANRRRFSHKQ